jgi:hypothetical protein
MGSKGRQVLRIGVKCIVGLEWVQSERTQE